MKKSTQYLALLRGINVGGNNLIKMTDLRECFEGLGFGKVTTYIQSGNVLFFSDTKPDLLISVIEKGLSNRFKTSISVVVVSHEELTHIVHTAPKEFGSEPAVYRYDVIFLKRPLTASEAIQSIQVTPGVDNVYKGSGVLFFSRLISKATKSRLSRIIQSPIYKSITIRNWNTTTKLLALMELNS